MSERQEYFETARTWATDAQLRDARLLRIAWIVAGIAIAIALFEAVALALLTPLKTVQPITLLVDRQTGYVQALDPLQPRRIGADAALTQAFLAQYVVAREGFDRATVSADYRRVALWSNGLPRTQYLALMPASNPESPFQRLPFGTAVTVRVKSVSSLSDGTALVRFDTQRQDRAGHVDTAQPWISVVRYRYSDAPMRFEDRLVDPLGFQVTGYRRDPEALPIAAPANGDTSPPQPAATVIQPTALVPAQPRARLRPVAMNIAALGLTAAQIPQGSPLVRPDMDVRHVLVGNRP